MEFVHSDSSSLYPFFHFSPFSSLFALSFPIRSVCPPQTTLGFLDRQINRQVDIALRSTPFFPSLLLLPPFSSRSHRDSPGKGGTLFQSCISYEQFERVARTPGVAISARQKPAALHGLLAASFSRRNS